MKKFKILAILTLMLGYFAHSQVRTHGNTVNYLVGQNAFIDASSFYSDEHKGKGLVFPRTDLTKFEFITTLLDGIDFYGAFDGMVVYNTGTGKTVTGNGAVVDVIPGFYYFHNPTGYDKVSTGQWEPLGDAATKQLIGIDTGTGPPTTTPTFNPPDPEAGDIYVDESNGDIYTFNGTTWVRNNGALVDADGDTGITLDKGGMDDDTIRFETVNTERMTIDQAGLVSYVGAGSTTTSDQNAAATYTTIGSTSGATLTVNNIIFSSTLIANSLAMRTYTLPFTNTGTKGIVEVAGATTLAGTNIKSGYWVYLFDDKYIKAVRVDFQLSGTDLQMRYADARFITATSVPLASQNDPTYFEGSAWTAGGYQIASVNITSATTAGVVNASIDSATGNAYFKGTLSDSKNQVGTQGQLLSTTGAGTEWVSTLSPTAISGSDVISTDKTITGTATGAALKAMDLEVNIDGTTLTADSSTGVISVNESALTIPPTTVTGADLASADKTIVAMNGDGAALKAVDLKVNIDGITLTADSSTGVISVDESALKGIPVTSMTGGTDGQILTTTVSGATTTVGWEDPAAQNQYLGHSTVHHGAATALAITHADHNLVDLHVESTGGLSIDSAAVTGGTTFFITNTTAANSMLSFTNFDGAYLRNGGGINDLSATGLNLKANTRYLVHITVNTSGPSPAYYFNAAEAGGGGVATGPTAPTTNPPNPPNPEGGDVYVDNSNGDIYTYNSTTNTWVKSNAALADGDGDTRIQLDEGGNDDDTIRFDTDGTERVTIDQAGLVSYVNASATTATHSTTATYTTVGSTSGNTLALNSIVLGTTALANSLAERTYTFPFTSTDTKGIVEATGATDLAGTNVKSAYWIYLYDNPHMKVVRADFQLSGTDLQVRYSNARFIHNLTAIPASSRISANFENTQWDTTGTYEIASVTIQSTAAVATTNASIDATTGNAYFRGSLSDSNNEAGNNGQILTSTANGTDWVDVSAISPISLFDGDSDTGIQVEKTNDDDIIRFDTDGAERMTIDNTGIVSFGIDAGGTTTRDQSAAATYTTIGSTSGATLAVNNIVLATTSLANPLAERTFTLPFTNTNTKGIVEATGATALAGTNIKSSYWIYLYDNPYMKVVRADFQLSGTDLQVRYADGRYKQNLTAIPAGSRNGAYFETAANWDSTAGAYQIATVNIASTATAAATNASIDTATGNAYFKGTLSDSSNDAGNSGQILTSTATGTNWIDMPSGADNLGDHTATQHLNMGTAFSIQANGDTGSAGQVLTRSATGNGMTWTSPSSTTSVQTITTTDSISDGVGLVLLTPSANITVTMPTAGTGSYPAGTVLHIRRTNASTGSNGITLSGSIEGGTTRLMNIGYQSNSFVATASGWLVMK